MFRDVSALVRYLLSNCPRVKGRKRYVSVLKRAHLPFTMLVIFSLVPLSTNARIIKTLKQALNTQLLSLTVGSGFEYQIDDDATEYDFPFLLERSLTKNLMLTIEPNYLYVHNKVGPSVSGFGELETAITYDFLAERRNRPGFSAFGSIKWPTASHAELGTGETDFSLGVIVGKEFVHTNLDLNAIYTFVGSSPDVSRRNSIEASLALEWHVSRSFSLLGELLTAESVGKYQAHSGLIGNTTIRASSERSLTLGLAEYISSNFQLEQGMVIQSDGSWQAVLSWEWSIGDED